MHDMRRVGLDFLYTARIRITGRQRIGAPKEDVFQYLKIGENWPVWHAQISSVEWTSPEPFGVGTTRTVVINNRFTAHEDFILWEENERFVFRFLQSDIPLATALAEDFRLRDQGGGTCELEWTVAGEVGGPLRLFGGVMQWINGRAINRTARALAAQFPPCPGGGRPD